MNPGAKLFCLSTLGTLLFATTCSSALARSSDRALPANADGTKFSGFIGPETKSKLDGNVVITQGTLRITGTHADLYTNKDSALARAVVTGDRAHVEQMDDTNLLMKADAQTIDYTVDTGIAVLTGSAHAEKQTGETVTGDILRYNVNTGLFSAESIGGSEGSPVHMMFYPKGTSTATDAGGK